MVRFDRMVYRIASSAASVVALYWIAGWDVKEPCAVFGFLILLLFLQDWAVDKKKALQLGRANRAKKKYFKRNIA